MCRCCLVPQAGSQLHALLGRHHVHRLGLRHEVKRVASMTSLCDYLVVIAINVFQLLEKKLKRQTIVYDD